MKNMQVIFKLIFKQVKIENQAKTKFKNNNNNR